MRDQGLLESACSRPYNLWAYENEEDVLELAAALMFGVARNHPFVDGNKRTAFVAGDMFLQANGYALSGALDGEDLADLFVAAISGEVSEEAFKLVLRRHIQG